MATGMRKYERVAQRVTDLVEQGTLATGQRIPSVRAMARQMRLSVMTVLEGYRLLEDRGLIESRPQSGYYVRPAHMRRPRPRVSLPVARMAPVAAGAGFVHVPEEVTRLAAAAARPDVTPLGAGLPALEHLPCEALSVRMARVVRTDPAAASRYSLGAGEAELRVELARRMIEAGASVSPEELVVTNGATEGLILALRSVTAAGDLVAVESPGYYGFYGALEYLGLRAAEVPSDPVTGVSVEAVERLLAGPETVRAVLLSSNFSNPTGATMPDERKRRLAELCRRCDVAVIEDDTYGELSHGATRPRPIKAIHPAGVIYVGSLSKVLAPGYRIGWVAAGRRRDDILRCRHMASLAAPTPTQLAVASFLADGGMARHLRRLRNIYAENLALFQRELVETFPSGARAGAPEGGHYLWVELPEAVDAVRLAERLAPRRISIAPGAVFSVSGGHRRYCRLNCAVTWTPEIRRALAVVGAEAARLADEA